MFGIIHLYPPADYGLIIPFWSFKVLDYFCLTKNDNYGKENMKKTDIMRLSNNGVASDELF